MPTFFSSSRTLVIFILAVAGLKSLHLFFFSFFITFQTLLLGVRFSGWHCVGMMAAVT